MFSRNYAQFLLTPVVPFKWNAWTVELCVLTLLGVLTVLEWVEFHLTCVTAATKISISTCCTCQTFGQNW